MLLQEDSHWDVRHNQNPKGFAAPAGGQPKVNGTGAHGPPQKLSKLDICFDPKITINPANVP